MNQFEPPEDRKLLAVTAYYVPSLRLLTVVGDNSSNSIIISGDRGIIRINNGAVPIFGPKPTVAKTTGILVLGLGGDDLVTLHDSNHPLPPATLLGAAVN